MLWSTPPEQVEKMQVDLKPSADHANGVVDAGLFVEQKLLRQQVDDLAVGGQ